MEEEEEGEDGWEDIDTEEDSAGMEEDDEDDDDGRKVREPACVRLVCTTSGQRVAEAAQCLSWALTPDVCALGSQVC